VGPASEGMFSLTGEPIVRVPLGVLGIDSGAAFAATSGPLIEEPAPIGLVKRALCFQ